MIHVEQKNILKKQGKKLGENNKWKQKSSKQETTQAKKPATLKKRDSISKNKANSVYCDFYYDFVWFSIDFREKQAKRG